MSHLSSTINLVQQITAKVLIQISKVTQQSYDKKNLQTKPQSNATVSDQSCFALRQINYKAKLVIINILYLLGRSKTKTDDNTRVLKYKYLNFLPLPDYLDKRTYDLVDEDEFFNPDGRLPLVIVTQHGVFPNKGLYNGKPKKRLNELEGLQNQIVGLVGKIYASSIEYKGILPVYVDDDLIADLKKNNRALNIDLWQ